MQGSYEDLSKSNKGFTEMINHIQMTAEAKIQSELADASASKPPIEKRLSTTSFLGRPSITSNASSVVITLIIEPLFLRIHLHDRRFQVSYNYEGNEDAPDEEDEVIASGRISNKVYKEYFHQGGSYFTLIALIFVFALSQVATSGNDYWVSYWTNMEVVRRIVTNSTAPVNPQYRYIFNDTFLSSIFTLDDNGLLPTHSAIYVYAFCLVSCIVIVCGRNIFFMTVCTNANKNLHNAMFLNVLRTKMSFFHHNPSGE